MQIWIWARFFRPILPRFRSDVDDAGENSDYHHIYYDHEYVFDAGHPHGLKAVDNASGDKDKEELIHVLVVSGKTVSYFSKNVNKRKSPL